MRLIKVENSIPVENLDYTLTGVNKKGANKHGPLLPSSIRALVIGPSNCGKTNVMLSLLLQPNALRFENVYIYSKSLYQPKYEYLEKVLMPIKGLGYYTFNNDEDIIQPSEIKPNSIFIFDDIICEKQNVISSYFSMGRHKDVDCFYLGQTYSKIPKQLIRDNANLIIAFKQDERNIKHLYSDHVAPAVSLQKLMEMCAVCWQTDHGFIVIDKGKDIENGKFKMGFDTIIYP